MPDLLNILTFLQTEGLQLLFKVLLLVLIFVYLVFTFIVITRVNSLNKTISLTASHASVLIKIFSLLFFGLTLFLFIATLVIV
jgi:hypothetical protein